MQLSSTSLLKLSFAPALFFSSSQVPWRLDPLSSIALLRSFTKFQTLRSGHAALLRAHILPENLAVSTAIISQYAAFGRISSAKVIFSICKPFADSFLWNTFIRALSDCGLHEEALDSYYSMIRETELFPDKFTYPAVLKSCGYLRNLDVGRILHDEAKKLGFDGDLFVANSLIAMYGKCWSPSLAREVFDRMSNRNLVTFTAMIGAYSWNGRQEEGFSLFLQLLKEERMKPNRATFLNVMSCARSGDDAHWIYDLVVENGFVSDLSVRNAALNMFSNCGRIDISKILFEEMPKRDLISWSSMIEAYAENNQSVEALDLFMRLKQQGNTLDYVILLSVIRACANLVSIRRACLIHGVALKSLPELNLVLQTALLDLYVKCGSIHSARRVFDQIKERNLVTWSTMIAGYGMLGHGNEALNLFWQMKKELVPDRIAYLSILSACSHSGLVKEGWECFNSMNEESGIMPGVEHYACMVDLMGRAGRLGEALEFIKGMPVEPDSSVWGSMLGACRIHSNLELAELAAKSLFELDPNNSGRYVLLLNIYSASGKRDDADNIRSLMKRRKIKKISGHTIIEVGDRVYKFLAGDRSNPQSELIYRELEDLMRRIREQGYVPDMNFVLHDVEEETKEQLLYAHSEKLAIVFGLLNLKPGSEIRIHKNLRVCGDCHTATKFISKVVKREILVRGFASIPSF